MAGKGRPSESYGTIRERLMRRLIVDENGCWLWPGAKTSKGYGQISVRYRTVYVHRAAYEEFKGPLPQGQQVDHRCHNSDGDCAGGPTCRHRRCWNPEHLEPATCQQNIVRGRNR